MREISFSEEEIDSILNILYRHGEMPMEICKGIREIWFKNENGAELRILFLSTLKLTVSRVCFEHRRTGTMTEIFAFLKEFCEKNQIQLLSIQSVETPEMAAWCKKQHIDPNPYASISIPEAGFTLGDYDLKLAGI